MSNCTICGGPASSRAARVRSGKDMTLWHCTACEFDFFAHDPTQSLAANKLDESRLKAAGLDIPAVERDFENGTAQSRGYIPEYIEAADAGRNVLEIGCSWGYFLKLAADAGTRPYGVELNTVRAAYVNEKLGIPCDTSLEACEQRGLKFRKIFLFYVLEYVPDPVTYAQRLVNMLEPGGALVMVTPNLDDTLKDLWRNEAFGRFFYDEHAVNYMSARSVDRMLERVTGVKSEVATRQGYSFVNHVSWFLTNAPRTTGVVGGDNFVRGILGQLRPESGSAAAPRQAQIAKDLAELLERFDAEYRRLIEAGRYGNQIRIVARK
jgi:2-polyprenyl-3-methyl-5-hydroxy-6-metoxy-1,4-benzoquinol methylase